MARGGRQDGEGWPARRDHQQPVADADRVFCREVRLWSPTAEMTRRCTMSSVSADERIRNGARWAWIKRSAALGLLSAAVVGSITFAAESAGDLKLPASFRHWYHVNTMVIDKG